MDEGEYCTIGLVDLQDGNKFIPIARTCTWNFQEAAMFHWLPWEDGACVFNDCRDGKFVAVAYFCHTIISKNHKRIFWLARTVENLDSQGDHITKWQTISFTCNFDGTDVRRCFPDGWGGSHFNWLDDETLAVTCQWQNKLYGHVVFKVGEEDKVRHIGDGLFDFDGHCIFSPNGKFISSDGYWNGYHNRSWGLIRLEDEAIMPLGHFYIPENYREGYSRCDLHPRWRPDGAQLGFNSVHEGSRQVYLRDVKWK